MAALRSRSKARRAPSRSGLIPAAEGLWELTIGRGPTQCRRQGPVTLTDELYDQASREAAAEGKTTDEITRDALKAYLALRRLDRLQE